MAKRKTFSKKSITRLPKGLPVRAGTAGSGGSNAKKPTSTATMGGTGINPFEMTQRMKRPKFAVHNRGTATTTTNQPPQRLSALAESLSKRQESIRSIIQASKKSNQFIDQRIGEAGSNSRNNTEQYASNDAKNLARLVRERTRQSKRLSKYALSSADDDDDDNNNDGTNENNILTHKGTAIKDMTDVDHVILSDDDDDDNENGNLDAYDTEMHFGGKGITRKDAAIASTYGGSNGETNDLSTAYTQKKLDLDDLIIRRKTMKLERIKSRETQISTFDAMDTSFQQLASLLQFRNKDDEIKTFIEQKRQHTLSKEDQEYDDWDREMKQYLHVDKKVAATDRTKTPEEIAKEEADRLHALETRRLARMNGDLEDDDDEDWSNCGNKSSKRRKMEVTKKKSDSTNPEALDNDDDDDSDWDHTEKDSTKTTTTTRFTSEGLVYLNKDGEVIGKVGDGKNDPPEDETDDDDDSDDNDDDAVDDDASDENEEAPMIHKRSYKVGDRIMANYRAKEQFDGHETWYHGTITKVISNNDDDDDDPTITFNIEYDDGDLEENVEPQYIRVADITTGSNTTTIVNDKDSDDDDDDGNEQKDKERAVELKHKRQKAMEQARSEIPYVFEVPTTLDALNSMIGNYAKTGQDVSLIIQRIHTANSVRLDRRNSEKMQNFYDVLLRRFVAVGDAIYTSGNGGVELDRYGQLDSITQILYAMAQESPDIAGAVWNRRLGLFQKAYTKRLRDFGMTTTADDEDFTAWPSTGVILLLRALGHVFPVTDKRHYVVTPTLLFLGQMLGHTPIVSIRDLVNGTICCGLLLEFTKEAKRIAPEVHAFLASVLRLYACNSSDRQGTYPLPTFQAASKIDVLATLRTSLQSFVDANSDTQPQISFESAKMTSSQMPSAILYAVLHMVESSIHSLSGSVESTEKEVFAEIVNSLLLLQVTDSKAAATNALPPKLKAKAASVVSILTSCPSISGVRKRIPLQRRAGMMQDQAIVTLAPRIENPDRYSVTQKDRHKTATQAAADRTRREYKREHKAVSRELRLDASMIETERRRVQDQKDSTAKAKRQRAFAWLESEQASMNQQVRQGGGLLQGGGTGAAKAKARTAKLGIKKGGKLR